MNKRMNLFALTWPIFIENVLFMLLGFIDIFVLSRCQCSQRSQPDHFHLQPGVQHHLRRNCHPDFPKPGRTKT